MMKYLATENSSASERKGLWQYALSLLMALILVCAVGFAAVPAYAEETDDSTAVESTDESEDEGESEAVVIDVDQVTGTATTMSSATAMNVTWSAVSDASGYELSYSTDAGSSWTTIDVGDATSYALTDLSSGCAVVVKTRAYQNVDETLYYGDWSSEVYRYTGKTSGQGSTLSVSKGTLAVSWNEFSASSGSVKYRVVCYKVSSSGTTTKVSSQDLSSTSLTLSLSSGSAYQVKVYPVVTVDGNEYLGVCQVSYRFVSKTTPAATMSTTSSIKVTCSEVSGASGYQVYYRVGTSGSWVTAETDSSRSYTISSLTTGNAVAIQARPYVTIGGKTYTGQWNDADFYRYTGKTSGQGSVMSTSKSTLTVSWNAFSASSGSVKYRVIYRSYSGSSWSGWTEKYTTSTSIVLSLSSSKAYQVKVYPVVTISGKSYLGVCQVSYRLMSSTTPSGSWSSSTSLKLSLTSVSVATGYEIQYSTSSSFSSYTSIKTTSTSYTISDLSSSTTYYVRVRPYKTISGTTYTGQWSSTKSYAYNAAKSSMINKAQSYSSSTSYLILVNRTTNKVGIFTGSKGSWTMKYYWDCTTGASSTPTPIGSYTVGSRGLSFSGTNYTCWYYTQFYGNYLFHSVLYNKGSMTSILDGTLGANKSHGCVRLSLDNAKWIYTNIPTYTKVIVY